MRVVSMQSKAKVYHREECRYAKKILPKNRMQLSSEAAEKEIGRASCRERVSSPV